MPRRALTAAGWLLPVVAALLLLPMARTQGQYVVDWANHYFLLNQQAEAIRQLGHPTYYLSSAKSGIFEPFWVFYGGTLYAVGAALVLLLGSTLAGFVASFVLAGAMAWTGLRWICRQLGVGSFAAHLPGLAWVTAAYFVSNAYGLGHWPELVATSSLPLVAAGALAVVREPEVRVRSLVGLWVGVVFMTGAHNITLLWGTTFFAVLVAALWLVAGSNRPPIPWRRVAIAAVTAGLAFGTNLWFLLPDIKYFSETRIYQATAGQFDPFMARTLTDFAGLFGLGRDSGDHPGVFVQTASWALIWALAAFVGAVLLHGEARRRVLRPSLVLLALLGVCSFLFLNFGVWERVPMPWRGIQSPERMATYVELSIMGLVIAGLVAVSGRRSAPFWIAGLCVLLAFQTYGAFKQADEQFTVATLKELADPVDPQGPYIQFVGADDYRLTTGPVVDADIERIVDPATALDGQVEISGPATDAPAVKTNIVYSPFLRPEGGRVVGRTDLGFAVFSINDHSRPWTIRVRTAMTRVQQLGLAITVLSLIASLGAVAFLLVRRRPFLLVRRRRRSA